MSNSSTDALNRLIQGNQRFRSGLRTVETLSSIMKLNEMSQRGQSPFGMILTCSDSRLPIEMLFDCDVGDLFIMRIAGAVVSPTIIASMEFAAQAFGTPLCVLLGHTDCGAIKTAMQYEKNKSMKLTRHLTHLVKKIHPVAKNSMKKMEGFSDEKIAQNIALENTRRNAKWIARQSPFLSALIRTGRFQIMGALCDVSTGVVTFETLKRKSSLLEDSKPALHSHEFRAS